MSYRNLGLLNFDGPHILRRAFSICILTGMTTLLAHAQSSSDWSGSVEYRVNPGNSEQTSWDYLPQTITYHTDGVHWRIDERGTSFERIWLGQHDATTYHVLFHFLGHAVELLETCPTQTRTESMDVKGNPAPCPWQSESRLMLEEEMTLTDGPVQYTIEQTQKQTMVRRYWPRGHFDLPEGYEPMDKMGLAALLSRLDGSPKE